MLGCVSDCVEATQPTVWSGVAPEGDNGTLKEHKTKNKGRKMLKLNRRRTKAIAIVSLCTGIMALMMFASLGYAAPTLALSPNRGSLGTVVTATGTNYTINGTVRIYFGPTLMNTTTADASGNLNTAFTVPSVSPGTYDVTAYDVTANVAVVEPFVVPALSITLNPTWGPNGTSVNVTGEGFSVLGLVKIYFNSTATLVQTTGANGSGAITTNFTVPSMPPATYPVKAYDWSTGNYAPDEWFTIPSPSITLNPIWGPPGTNVTVTGGNFTFGGEVRIYFYGTSVQNATATGTGTINTWFLVPSVSPSTYTVNATDVSTGGYGTKPFTVPSPSLIAIDPTWGPPNTNITVTGGNFTVSGNVTIYFDETLVRWDLANGTGYLSTTFLVPSVLPGTYDVKAYGSGWASPIPFVVPPPSITLNVTSGPPGLPVVVTGGNFTVSGNVTIYFDGTSVANTTADGTGAISTPFDVPDKPAGSYTVRAMDVATTANATQPFTIPSPSITLTPDGGPPDTNVTVTGPNFKVNGNVTIYFDGTLVGWDLANATGYLNTTFLAPSVSPATYTVNATDGINYATASFTVGPVIWITPTSGPSGITISVTGAGLTINGTAGIYFDTTFIKNVTANSAGTISTTFPAPHATAGAHNVTAYDWGTATTTPPKTFTISSPSIELSPTTGPVYTNVTTVTGSNFKINGTVNIYFGTTLVKTVNATSNGAISTFFYVPDVLPGVYTVNATDGINYATATFHITGAGGTTTITQMLTEIEYKLDTLNITVTVDLTPVLNAIAEIEAKLDEGGTFYTFVNNWFTTIGTKLDAIKAKTDLINWTDIKPSILKLQQLMLN